MQLIDTHTHLYLPEFDTDRDEVVNRAVGNGILKMLLPNIDIQSVDQMLSAVKIPWYLLSYDRPSSHFGKRGLSESAQYS